MKQIPILIIILMVASGVFYGCITEFEPKGIEEVRDLLIVDGTITEGESTIILRHSVGLTEDLTGREYIDEASLSVETDAGDIFTAELKGSGRYVIKTGILDPNKKYRLNISYNGDQYQSTYLEPLYTPEIDSISPEKRGQGQPVYMCVNTHDPQNNSRYYRWSFRETWEVESELVANARWENGNIIEHNIATSENTYYCWGRDSSKTLLLGSTEKLSENVISYKRLRQIDPADDRLSCIYHIMIEQIQIRKEAYDYLSNLQKNIEQTGSIFTPMPSEMKGNIHCITNSDLPVIGYIEVATITRKDRYFPKDYGLYEAPIRGCFSLVTEDSDYAPPVYAYYEYYPGYKVSYAPPKCVDCRLKEKASKIKPENWPNNHL